MFIDTFHSFYSIYFCLLFFEALQLPSHLWRSWTYLSCCFRDWELRFDAPIKCHDVWKHVWLVPEPEAKFRKFRWLEENWEVATFTIPKILLIIFYIRFIFHLRVHASSINYETFFKSYKNKSTPVIIEGWLSQHPRLQSWNLSRLATECGNQPVQSVQRRFQALINIKNKVPGVVARAILDTFLLSRFNSTLDNEIKKANGTVDLKSFIDSVQHLPARKGTSFSTIWDYITSSITINDFPAESLCPAFANDIFIPELSARETLHFDFPLTQDPMIHPVVFIEADGGRILLILIVCLRYSLLHSFPLVSPSISCPSTRLFIYFLLHCFQYSVKIIFIILRPRFIP